MIEKLRKDLEFKLPLGPATFTLRNIELRSNSFVTHPQYLSCKRLKRYCIRDFYRPRNEGNVFRGVCHFNSGGEVDNTKGKPPRPPPRPGSEVNHFPPPPLGQGQRSTTSSPPGQGQRSTTPPPLVRTTHPPKQGKVNHLPHERKVIDLPPPPLSPPPPPPTTSGHYALAGGTHPTGMHSCLTM